MRILIIVLGGIVGGLVGFFFGLKGDLCFGIGMLYTFAVVITTD